MIFLLAEEFSVSELHDKAADVQESSANCEKPSNFWL
jgi:hypothetical protein